MEETVETTKNALVYPTVTFIICAMFLSLDRAFEIREQVVLIWMTRFEEYGSREAILEKKFLEIFL